MKFSFLNNAPDHAKSAEAKKNPADTQRQATAVTMRSLSFWLVDVFAREPMSGNGLSVFLLDQKLPANAMQRITREMRQFETIFLHRINQSSRFEARIFTMEEELPFAGHPVIGAAALLHSRFYSNEEVAKFEFVMRDRAVEAVSRRQDAVHVAEMDQGIASFEPPIPEGKNEIFSRALNLSIADLEPDLPLQVVSTGLPY
ncbi:MAG: PhzF family phenazine biosynthesis isomerase, partial [Lysobacterales bacterium]